MSASLESFPEQPGTGRQLGQLPAAQLIYEKATPLTYGGSKTVLQSNPGGGSHEWGAIGSRYI